MTTRASLKDAVQTFARSYALDIDETDAVEKEAEEALIATHVSWQLGTLDSFLPEPRPLGPLWRLKPHTYVGVSNQTFVKVAEFWLRRDEYFIRELATRFGASRLSLVDVGAGTGTLSAIVAAVLNSPDIRLVDIDNTETNKGLGSDAAALFSRSFDAAHHDTRANFDGRTLDFDDDQYDVALLTYVLHHAAGDTIPLLKEAKRSPGTMW